MPDKTLVCVDCGKEFVFTEGEQAFYQEKGLHEPKRCKECRAKARERRSANNNSASDSSTEEAK